ncbi:MAG TPA: TetR/AcrR family transcriptional regulator [Thermoanaerobaculia bacterium]|nr:TetR/AcrR family transcriptional regulator [Thermoanaerobaculia bacterium]
MGRPPRISRDQILEAARAAFQARGFAATTLADIAKALDVTPAAILKYFDSKQALFSAAMATQVLELASLDPDEDPRIALADFARRLIPFLTGIIRSAIAVQMHATTLTVPFDPRSEDVPPRRVIRLLADYFGRAMKRGTIRRADPQALALLFLGQLQAYVFFHQVLAVTPAYPLDTYIDTLIDLWSTGVLNAGRASARSSGGTRAEESHPRARRSGRGHGDAAVPAQPAQTEAARPRRDAGGKDGARGVAGRRPRGPRTRR